MASKQLTPAQIALQEERKAKKLNHNAQSVSDPTSKYIKILHRPWISLSRPEQKQTQQLKILTWNLLAQCLVRRELFPTSNCLKAAERLPMLYREILAYDVDVLCLQEVDCLEKLLPRLETAGYSHRFAAGRGKKHGCLIAFKKDLYTFVSEEVVHYDEEIVRSHQDERARRGSSFKTKNIGFLVAVKNKVNEEQGLIIATTHLFWHPRYTYERARQAAILVRAVTKFRSSLSFDHWPSVIGGDFNFPPDDPSYSLLVGDDILPEQDQRLGMSRVVHFSVDPSVPTLGVAIDDGGEAGDPDRIITNARAATVDDGLLSTPELISFYSRGSQLRSVYDEARSCLQETGNDMPSYGKRVNLATNRRGFYEPEYTSYTHYWKTVLDYLFIIDPIGISSTVTAILSPHNTADLVPGLPQQDICASDHVSLGAEISWGGNI